MVRHLLYHCITIAWLIKVPKCSVQPLLTMRMERATWTCIWLPREHATPKRFLAICTAQWLQLQRWNSPSFSLIGNSKWIFARAEPTGALVLFQHCLYHCHPSWRVTWPVSPKRPQLGCLLWNVNPGEILINPSRAMNDEAGHGSWTCKIREIFNPLARY